MQFVLLIAPILVPVIFWAAYHYHKDRHLPEPPGNLLLCFLLGLLGAALSKGLYLGLEPLGLRFDALALAQQKGIGLLLYCLLAIGPIEEFAKLLPFLLVVMRFRAFDEPLDGIIYASFIALGYAAVENYFYLEYLGPIAAIARGFAGPAIHILFASIWAYWITRAHIAGLPIFRATLTGFLLAAGLHGIYDFLVLRYPLWALPLAAAMIGALWVWRLQVMRRMHDSAAGRSGDHQPRS